MIRRTRLAPLLALVALTSACGGLPDRVKRSARTLESRIAGETQAIEQKERDLAELREGSDYAFLRTYAERERWDESFVKARTELRHVRALFEDQVRPLLGANRAEDALKLAQQLDRVRAGLTQVRALVRSPFERAEFLQEARAKADEWVAEAAQTLQSMAAQAAAVSRVAEKAASDYPAKQQDLDSRLAALAKLETDASADLAIARRELPGVPSGEADVAALGDAVTRIRERATALGEADPELRARMDELYRSYSRTLIDMKEAYHVKVSRSSWNNRYDYPTEHQATFRSEVDEDTLDYLERWGNRPIARLGRSWGSWKLTANVKQPIWDALRIDPSLQWPRGDDSSEFWFEDAEEHYYHRYTTTEGATQTESDWEEVSAELYAAHVGDLGMDILSKPYGLYEDEVLRQAMPPGYAHVGNPAYGRWERDDRGRRHWSWGNSFLFYYLAFGPRRHHYYYNDWNHWNRGYRGQRAYYGRQAARDYGTYGGVTQRGSRYASSTVARRGGFERADRSIRGAGAGTRGGGPGRGK